MDTSSYNPLIIILIVTLISNLVFKGLLYLCHLIRQLNHQEDYPFQLSLKIFKLFINIEK